MALARPKGRVVSQARTPPRPSLPRLDAIAFGVDLHAVPPKGRLARPAARSAEPPARDFRLPEGLQDSLLARAETERWSVQTLRREVGSLVGRRRNRLRTVAPAFARCLRAMETEIEGRRLLADIELVDRLTPDEARHLLDSLKALLQQGAILAKNLNDRIREVPTTRPPPIGMPHPVGAAPSSAHLRALRQATRPS